MSRIALRRSNRIQNDLGNCELHDCQPDLGKHVSAIKEKALCGMLAFNNALHSRVLSYHDCLAVAMKWTKAKNTRDPILTTMADNEGRGAFHVSVLHAAIFKKGYEVINCLRKGLICEQGMQSMEKVYALRPCILFMETHHAVSLCDRGNFHDPDMETVTKLKGPRELSYALCHYGRVCVVYKVQMLHKVPLQLPKGLESGAPRTRKRKLGRRGGRDRKRCKTCKRGENQPSINVFYVEMIFQSSSKCFLSFRFSIHLSSKAESKNTSQINQIVEIQRSSINISSNVLTLSE